MIMFGLGEIGGETVATPAQTAGVIAAPTGTGWGNGTWGGNGTVPFLGDAGGGVDREVSYWAWAWAVGILMFNV